jgi:RNA polymerase sigma-B factor
MATAAPLADLDALHFRFRATRDPALRERLVVEYQGLARHLANLFAHRGQPGDDLNQVATMALLKAVDRFDPDRGVKFSTYAARVVTGELKRHFRDRAWAVRVPRSLQELYLASRRAADDLQAELGRDPTVAQVAARVGIGEEGVLEAMEAGFAYRIASLDAPRPGGDGRGWAEPAGADDGFAAVEDRLARHQRLTPLLSRLGEQDRRLTWLYYGEGLSQAEIGARLGMSQVAVSRRLARILGRLRALAGVG